MLDCAVLAPSFGVVTRWHDRETRFPGVLVASLMTAPVVTVHARMSLRTVAMILFSRDIAQVPVTDGVRRLVGMIRRYELIAALAGEQRAVFAIPRPSNVPRRTYRRTNRTRRSHRRHAHDDHRNPHPPDAFVDALNGMFGRHVGHRPLHARATADCTGRFVATLAAARLSRAAHFSGVPIPVTARFSAESGAPADADAANDDKGLAVRFNLPDGDTDIVSRRTPVAMASTPEGFLAFLQAVRTDPATGKPDPATVGAMVAAHPDVRPFLAAHDALTPIASVADAPYFAVHTFRLLDAHGVVQPGRYRWEPATLAPMSAPAITPGDRDYYAGEMRERLARGPVAFHLRFQLPAPGDDLNDPTTVWPETRPVVTLGRLELTSLVTGDPNPVEAVVYNPTNFTDGIAASDDPVLAVRQAVYERSFARRATPTSA